MAVSAYPKQDRSPQQNGVGFSSSNIHIHQLFHTHLSFTIWIESLTNASFSITNLYKPVHTFFNLLSITQWSFQKRVSAPSDISLNNLSSNHSDLKPPTPVPIVWTSLHRNYIAYNVKFILLPWIKITCHHLLAIEWCSSFAFPFALTILLKNSCFPTGFLTWSSNWFWYGLLLLDSSASISSFFFL